MRNIQLEHVGTVTETSNMKLNKQGDAFMALSEKVHKKFMNYMAQEEIPQYVGSKHLTEIQNLLGDIYLLGRKHEAKQ